ncbi:MAG: sulfotransferase domain-containing protein [Phycisphaerales bacterium]
MSQPPARVILVTVPKAGTYLVSEIVRRLGFEQTHLHLAMTRVVAYDPALLDEGRSNPARFEVKCPIRESIRLVRCGQFAASHLPYEPEAVSALSGCRVVFATRELRSALVSWMRFYVATGRASGPKAIEDTRSSPQEMTIADLEANAGDRLDAVKKQLGWLEHEGIHVLRYEDLIARDVATIGSLREFLQPAPSTSNPASDESIIEQALATDTLTRTTEATRLDAYWSDEAEEIFHRLGGPQLNQRLGYPESALRSSLTTHALT